MTKDAKVYDADVYPYYAGSMFFRFATKLMIWFTVIVAATKLICNFLLQILFDFLSCVDWNSISNNFKFGLIQNPNTVHHTTSTELRSFNDIAYIHTWSDGWARFNNFWAQFHILDFCISLTISLAMFYILTIILRHHSGEHQPFQDDHAAKQLRKDIINALSAEIVIFPDEDRRKDTPDEKQYKSNIRAVSVAIHTRLNPNSHRIMQTYKVRFPKPANKREVDLMLRSLNGFDANLNGLLRGRVDFGAMENNLRDVSLVFRGEREMNDLETKQLRRVQKWAKKNQEHEPEIKVAETEYAFPLSLFKDNSKSIAGLRAKATEWAEKTKKNLDIVLNSAEIQATIKSTNVGNTTIQYVYTMPFSTDYSKVLNMEETISNALSIRGVQVGLDAGNLAIAIPSPKEVQIPIDVPTMIQQVFETGGKS
ncbi:DNA translocase FtsK [Lactiplantibacillus plantarum]|uniref:DNA translocase FtsK n=1 Tax=Lactiplantibacillus plantarum TaxID=1590 RepID=UPI00200118F7|nr:DNA translocase FtsK [Lactiplantibacillus plantarum]